MVAHEYAHGYAALRQGDDTAKQLGRLTWNPLKHIDPLMTVGLPVLTFLLTPFIFGGAKPVPVNPANYRNYRRGDIIVSLAGIVVNLALVVACTVAIIALGFVAKLAPVLSAPIGALQAIALVGVLFNLVLAFFNLLPIPPLDGSHVFKYLLPPAWALYYERIGFFGIVLLLVFLPVLRPLYMGPIAFGMRLVTSVSRDFIVPESVQILRNAGLIGV